MTAREQEKAIEHKLEKAKHHLKADAKEYLSEIQDIKENVVGLAQTLKDSSAKQMHVATDYVRDRIDEVKDSGTEAVKAVEKQIKAKPRQSVAIAFAAGFVASYLFGRRSS